MTTVAPDRTGSALPGTPLDRASHGLDACVHCGFCLQACPTYVNLDDENDSPRGRLVLMRRMLDGAIAVDDRYAAMHIDRCLGCRACETACPSGVPYGELLEATRATMIQVRGLPLTARIILAVFARKRLLRIMLGMARVLRNTGLPRIAAKLLPRRFAFPMAMLASTAPQELRAFVRRRNVNEQQTDNFPRSQRGKAAGHRPGNDNGDLSRTAAARASDEQLVATLDGCVMQGLFGHVNAATMRCVERAGCRLVDAPLQGCCGALHAHAGDEETARALARRNIEAFEQSGADYIVSNSAGCGAMMKGYSHILRDDPQWAKRAAQLSSRVRDASEFLADRLPVPQLPIPVRVTHDAPCHQMHAQRIVNQPLALLGSIPELVLVPLEDADQCCGSAGIYNLIEPETSDAVLAPKLRNIRNTGAQLVATGNPGCMMQLGAGSMLDGEKELRVVHPLELVDAAYGDE